MFMLSNSVGGRSHRTQLQGSFSSNCTVVLWLIWLFSSDVPLLVVNYVLYSCLRYKIYDLPNTLYTKPVWTKSVNPRIEETVHIVALSASREFLDYLLTNALIVDLWGLQGTSFAPPSLQCAVQPGLMLQRAQREARGAVEQWVSIFCQAPGSPQLSGVSS